MPAELEDVSKYPVLFEELRSRGWTDADLMKLAGENLLRVFKEAEKVCDNNGLFYQYRNCIGIG